MPRDKNQVAALVWDFHPLLTRNNILNSFSPLTHAQSHSLCSLCGQIVSTLSVEDSSASGVYHCVAANKVGQEERSVAFYVSGEHQPLPRHCCCSELPVSLTWLLSAAPDPGHPCVLFFGAVPGSSPHPRQVGHVQPRWLFALCSCSPKSLSVP